MIRPPVLTGVSHVAIEVGDTDRMGEFYTDLWGLEFSDADRENLFLRAARSDHHVASLYKGTPGTLHHVAFEVATPDDLARAADAAVEAGGEHVYGPGPSPDEPGIDRLVRFRDPDGNVFEAVHGMEQMASLSGTRGASPQNLNHVVINVSDLDRSEAFYTRALGFRVSDWIPGFMTFLTCSSNHHTLALKLDSTGGLDHAAFTTRDWSELCQGVFFLGERGVPRVWGPGRHGPGHVLFSYFKDPEGNVVEYATDVAQVDDGWQASEWSRSQGNLWLEGDASGDRPEAV